MPQEMRKHKQPGESWIFPPGLSCLSGPRITAVTGYRMHGNGVRL